MFLEILLIVLGVIFIIIGLLGCVLPVIPGPPISWVGILMLHLTERVQFSVEFLIIWLVIAVLITIVDNIIPVLGTKRAGGSKWGIRGSAIGLIIGLFFGPIGIFIGPFLGALVGEILYFETKAGKVKSAGLTQNEKHKRAFLSALGSFVGLLFGIVLKLIVSGILTFKFIQALIQSF
ncbi:MAG: DUF456 domain-containing protein [Bacteroidales bacterium]|jgi:uncharacterized protein YqgC (DUF456 family)|nr:DUF456 domain-containing protein [Bacteroidales bacterium]